MRGRPSAVIAIMDTTEHGIDLHPQPVEPWERSPRAIEVAWGARRAFSYRRAGKRGLDAFVAAAALLLLAPAFLLIAIAIKLDSRGPVFYRTRRIGYRGQPLAMLKFRKMHDDAAGLPLTAARDPRLTRVGRRLTATRMDELPQLWDVLRGRMSLIGPRPEDPTFVALHRDDYDDILTVRPGLTGLSQIAYKEEARIVDDERPVDDYVVRIMPQKLTLDRLYAARCSPGLDLRIGAWTVATVLFGLPVSVHRHTAGMSVRRGRPRPGSDAHQAARLTAIAGAGRSEPALAGPETCTALEAPAGSDALATVEAPPLTLPAAPRLRD